MSDDDTRGIECPERPVDSSPTTHRLLADGGPSCDTSASTDSKDGETSTRSSKYVVPIGLGYLARYTIDDAEKVTISTAALGDLEWPTGTRVAAGHDVVSELEIEPGDNIRIYGLEAVDGREGLLTVDAEDDPVDGLIRISVGASAPRD
ncbi:hypothetical protein [Halostagnicola bangensis]